MRENQAAIYKAGTIRELKGQKWVYIKTPSPRELHNLCKSHARTPGLNRHWFNSGSWNNIKGQTFETLDSSGIADEPLEHFRAASANLPPERMRPSRAVPAVTGAVWNVPAVMANLPLSAITRARTKLPPRDIKIALSISGMVKAQELAAPLAKLAKACNEYTLKGGVVSLSLISAAFFWRKNYSGEVGILTETRINCADAASVAFCLSPAFARCILYPISAGASDDEGDSLRVVRPEEFPMPGITVLSGYGNDIFREMDKLIATLQP